MPPTDYESFLQKGTAEYHKGDNTAAVRAFERALQHAQKMCQRIQATDMRIGPTVKLKQLEAATILAKSIIRMDRTDPRGYIRAAQVERLEKRPDKAAQWYKQGLKHVSTKNTNYDLLKQGLLKCESLETSIKVHSKPRDPFANLPVEVAQIILQHFDYKEMVAVLRVSKGWKRFVQKDNLLATTVDFSRASSKTVSLIALRSALRRLTQYPTSARISNLSTPAVDNLLGRLPEWFRRNTISTFTFDQVFPQRLFEHLPIGTGLKQCKMRIEQWFPLNNLMTFCRLLENLHLTIEPTRSPPYRSGAVWSRLQHEKLINLRLICPRDVILDLPQIEMPNLEYLDLEAVRLENADFSDLQKLKILRLFICEVRLRFFEVPSTIQHLCVMGCGSLTLDCRPSNVRLPDLISVQGDCGPAIWGLHFLEKSKSLEFLDISAPALEQGFATMLASMPQLRTVIVRNARHITGLFVKDLCAGPSKSVRQVDIYDCEKVSYDTVTWAQKYNVSVNVRQAGGPVDDGGRRLRHLNDT